jgi:hypothetical protein
VKIKLNYKAFKALRKDPAVVEDLNERALRIRQACGDGFVVEVAPSRNRARVTVQTDTFEARRRNATEQTLIRNLDAGR